MSEESTHQHASNILLRDVVSGHSKPGTTAHSNVMKRIGECGECRNNFDRITAEHGADHKSGRGSRLGRFFGRGG